MLDIVPIFFSQLPWTITVSPAFKYIFSSGAAFRKLSEHRDLRAITDIRYASNRAHGVKNSHWTGHDKDAGRPDISQDADLGAICLEQGQGDSRGADVFRNRVREILLQFRHRFASHQYVAHQRIVN